MLFSFGRNEVEMSLDGSFKTLESTNFYTRERNQIQSCAVSYG